MKTLKKILLIATILLTAACSYEEMANKLIPKEESTFAQNYLQKLRNKEFDHINKYVDDGLKAQVNNEKLVQIADYFPNGELLSTELIGSQVHTFNSEWQGNFTFEYQFTGGWALANAALKKIDDQITVIGFNVYRTEASQRELNKFSLSGKSAIQYIILAMAAVAPLFVLVTTFFCIKTPIPKRKWLWVLFVLVGIGSISVNWTTGQYGIQPLHIKLFSASAVAAGPFAPWVISASIPLGAILFWFKRQGFIQASMANHLIKTDR